MSSRWPRRRRAPRRRRQRSLCGEGSGRPGLAGSHQGQLLHGARRGRQAGRSRLVGNPLLPCIAPSHGPSPLRPSPQCVQPAKSVGHGHGRGSQGAPLRALWSRSAAADSLPCCALALAISNKPLRRRRAAQMITAAERAGKLTPQFMGALAATLGSPLEDTIVVAGGNTIMVRAC